MRQFNPELTSTQKEFYAYISGEWAALDRVLSMLNSIDTEGMTPDQVRRTLYNEVLKCRPAYGMCG